MAGLGWDLVLTWLAIQANIPVSSMMDENLAAYGSRRMTGAIDGSSDGSAGWFAWWTSPLWRSMRLGAAILWRSKRWQPEIEPDGSGRLETLRNIPPS